MARAKQPREPIADTLKEATTGGVGSAASTEARSGIRFEGWRIARMRRPYHGKTLNAISLCQSGERLLVGDDCAFDAVELAAVVVDAAPALAFVETPCGLVVAEEFQRRRPAQLGVGEQRAPDLWTATRAIDEQHLSGVRRIRAF